jgi:hypothetical protein
VKHAVVQAGLIIRSTLSTYDFPSQCIRAQTLTFRLDFILSYRKTHLSKSLVDCYKTSKLKDRRPPAEAPQCKKHA